MGVRPFLILWAMAHAAMAFVPPELEPGYIRALMAYREEKLDLALASIEGCLQSSQKIPEFWQLKARICWAQKKKEEVRGILKKLISFAQEMGEAAGPYYYDLGRLAQENGEVKPARENFEAALSSGFNIPGCHFHLGVLEYEEGEFRIARSHFASAVDSGSPLEQTRSRIYLAAISEKLANPIGSVRNYIKARDTAENSASMPPLTPHFRKWMEDTSDKIRDITRGYDNSLIYARVAASTGFDSNVLFVPPSAIIESSPSTGSYFMATTVGAGYATSPMQDWQLAGAYDASLNYEFNPASKAGQFLSHRLNLQAIRGPLLLKNYGAQIDTVFNFQTREDSGDEKFMPYNLLMVVGPFARWELSSNWVYGGSVAAQWEKNFLDPLKSEEQKRGGLGVALTTFIANVENNLWWNPYLSLSLSDNITSGASLRGIGAELIFSNPMYINPRFAIVQMVSLSASYFYSRPELLRSDQKPALALFGIWKVTDQLNARAQMRYSRNLSNIEDHRYSRLYWSLGMGYTF